MTRPAKPHPVRVLASTRGGWTVHVGPTWRMYAANPSQLRVALAAAVKHRNGGKRA